MEKIADNKALRKLTGGVLNLDPWLVDADDKVPSYWAYNTPYRGRQITKEEIHQYVYAMGRTAKMAEVYEDHVVVETPDGRKEIPCDSVITSIGFTSGSVLAGKNNKRLKHIHFIGDVNTVGNIKTAVYAANDLVLKLSK